MLQRIQTLFLLLAALLSSLLLFGDLMGMTDVFGNIYQMNFHSVIVNVSGNIQTQDIWPVAILIVSVPVLSVVSVFLFRNRSLQMKTTMAALLISIASLFVAAYFVIMLGRKVDLTYQWNIKTVIPVVNAVLFWLAYRAIGKDEEKVKSLDRIR